MDPEAKDGQKIDGGDVADDEVEHPGNGQEGTPF